MTIPVVVTFELDGHEIEWRGQFTKATIEHLFSDFANGCEADTFESWEDGEKDSN